MHQDAAGDGASNKYNKATVMADLVCDHEEHRLHKNDDGHQADPAARGHGAVCRGRSGRRRRRRRRACHHSGRRDRLAFHTALNRAGARHCA
eukprot:7232585-Pyramimonas_sp.AAC.1